MQSIFLIKMNSIILFQHFEIPYREPQRFYEYGYRVGKLMNQVDLRGLVTLCYSAMVTL